MFPVLLAWEIIISMAETISHIFFARTCGARTDANKWKLSQPRMKVVRQNMCSCFRSWETWLCFWKKLPMCLIFKLYCFPRCSVSSKGDHFLCSFFKNHITEIAQIFFARASGARGDASKFFLVGALRKASITGPIQLALCWIQPVS